MRNATRIAAAAFGAVAGIAGIEHGVFEMLQGSTRPDGLFIASIGPPCDPETTWNACEPALTILPNFLITGMLATLIGLLILIWGMAFVHRSNGGVVLMLLSVALLVFGGGIFPPVIGLIGGLAGVKINKPLIGKRPGSISSFAAKLWPWPLVIFLVWVLAQFPVGYFFNDFLQSVMYVGLLLILVTLPLSVYTAYAHDVQTASQGE